MIFYFQIEVLNQDLKKKDTEIQFLKSKNDNSENKQKDLNQYISVLRESINAKEQQILMQLSDIADYKTRLREKESIVEKKINAIRSIQIEKHQIDSDIGEIRDQMDIKERKIRLLNRKVSLTIKNFTAC